MDEYAAEVALNGDKQWQNVVLSATDFRNAANEPMGDWTQVRALRLGAREDLQQKANGEQTIVELGAEWQGVDPEFGNLQWKR